jgi:hypothetical protein
MKKPAQAGFFIAKYSADWLLVRLFQVCQTLAPITWLAMLMAHSENQQFTG